MTAEAEAFDDQALEAMRERLGLEGRLTGAYLTALSDVGAALRIRGISVMPQSDELRWYELSTLVDERVLVTTALLDAVEMRHAETGREVSEQEVDEIADQLEERIQQEIDERDSQLPAQQALSRIAEKLAYLRVLREYGGGHLVTPEELSAVKKRLQARIRYHDLDQAWFEVIDDMFPGAPLGDDDEVIRHEVADDLEITEVAQDVEVERLALAIKARLEENGLQVESVGGLLALSELAIRRAELLARGGNALQANWPDEVRIVLGHFQIPLTDHWLKILAGEFTSGTS